MERRNRLGLDYHTNGCLWYPNGLRGLGWNEEREGGMQAKKQQQPVDKNEMVMAVKNIKPIM